MANSLGLDDDLDGVEVLIDLERVFDIKVTDQEAERTYTVGDFYDLLLTKLPATDGRKCASAMSFYRLRRAFIELGYETQVTPASDIRSLERGRLKPKLQALSRISGLHLPPPTVTKFGCILVLITFAAVVAFTFALVPNFAWGFLGFFLALLAAGVVVKLDPGNLPDDCSTFADLARKTANLNYGRLAKMGARNTEEEIWECLIETLSVHSLPKSEITRDTFFLASQLKKTNAA